MNHSISAQGYQFSKWFGHILNDQILQHKTQQIIILSWDTQMQIKDLNPKQRKLKQNNIIYN